MSIFVLKSGEIWRFRGMPGAMGMEKAATQIAREKAVANRQNYISLPPTVAQTARENFAGGVGHTGKVWQESKRNPQQRMPAACGKQFRKGGSANRAGKTARTGRITVRFRQR